MSSDKESLLRMHAGALNGHDPDSVIGHYHAGARFIRDGALVGEGPDAVRKAFLEEFAVSEELVGRVMQLDGEHVLVEWDGVEGRGQPRGIVRLQSEGGRVTELRVDHDVRRIERLPMRDVPMRDAA